MKVSRSQRAPRAGCFQGGRLIRKWLGVLLAAGVLISCGGANVSNSLPTPEPTAMPAPTGYSPEVAKQIELGQRCPDAFYPIHDSIVFSENADLMAIGPAGQKPLQLTVLPTNTRAHSPVWSPDGKTLAFILGYMVPDPAVTWLQVGIACGIDRATGKGKLLARGAMPTESFEEVAWASNGQALLLTRYNNILNEQKQLEKVDIAIVRYDLASNESTALIVDGVSPAAAPDGQSLAFIQLDRQPRQVIRTLTISDSNGRNPRALGDTQSGFTYISGARWSPDSRSLVFSASTGPQGRGPAPGLARRLFDWAFAPAVAEAHGDPQEIWLIGADAKGLRRLTNNKLDDPHVAWGPDGRKLVFTSTLGSVIVLDSASGQQQPLTQEGLFGMVDWAWK